MTDLKIEQRQRARHVADELNEALCKRDIGRAEAVLFVNRIVIHEALEAFASPPPQEGIEDRARALTLARPIVEADLVAAKEHCDADWEGMSYTALEAIDAALRTDSVAGGDVEAVANAPNADRLRAALEPFAQISKRKAMLYIRPDDPIVMEAVHALEQ